MPVPRLDPAACARRNLAAALEGRNAAPMTLSGSVPPPHPPDGFRLVTASGTLPASDEDAAARINDSLGLTGTADAIPRDRLLLVYPEVANQNYIAKYQMFLGLSTLKNIAARGADGIALMNSHRTGGMSTPAEFPYGRTFCSRLETMADETGAREHRVILGGYMLSGLYPNGANGPSTDDLHAAIVGGTLNEVSLGFSSRGRSVCDVCGRDSEETDEEGDYLCNHVPGTHRGMDKEMVRAQLARGVPEGVATFTLEDADVNELSACYAGALPGAAFRKTARLARRAKLSAADLGAARAAFAPLLSADPAAFGPPAPRPPADPQPKGSKPVAGRTITLTDAFEFWDSTGRPRIALNDLMTQLGGGAQDPPAPAPPAAPPADPPAPVNGGNSPVERQLAAMREEMQREREERERERREARAAAVALEADRWAETQIRAGRGTAAERPTLVSLYARAAEDDESQPVQMAYRAADGTPKLGTRLDVFKAGVELRPARPTGRRVVAGNPDQAAGAGAAPQDGTVLQPDAPAEDEMQMIYDHTAAYANRLNGTGGRGMSGRAKPGSH